MSGELNSRASTLQLVPDLVLIVWNTNGEGLHVYGVGLSGAGAGGIIFKRLFSFHPGKTCGTGFAVSGSKLVAVGSTWNATPKECLIWDLTGWLDRDEFNCRKIQTLGEKPYPVVFESNGRVFALAGLGHTGKTNKPNTVFEVLDVATDGGTWMALPDPPFVDEYCKEYPPPEVKSHTIIGKKLYLAIFYPAELGLEQCWNSSLDIGGGGGGKLTSQESWQYYSYDIGDGTWEKIVDTAHMDPVAKNFMNHCWSEKIDCIDDDLMVFASRQNKEVYACDLNSNLEELAPPSSPVQDPPTLPQPVLEEEEEEKKAATDDGDDSSTGSLEEIGSLDSADLEEYHKKRTLDPADYQFSPDDDSGSDGFLPFEEPLSHAYLPVHGLDIKKKIPKSFANSHMVARLEGDVYCAVFFYLPYEDDDECQKIHVTTFSVLKEEGSIKATVLESRIFETKMVMNIEAWCVVSI